MVDKPTIVILGFRTTYERNFDATGKYTGKNDRPVDWLLYSPAHMAMFQQQWERIEWMNPANIKNASDDENGSKKQDFMRWRWAQIEPAYNAWKKGHEIPVNGVPLANWPGLNAAQAEVLRKMGISSVEQVASMNDAIMTKVQLPGVREIRAGAQTFLDAQGGADMANRLTSMEESNAALQEQLAAAMALLEEQTKPKKKAREQEAA